MIDHDKELDMSGQRCPIPVLRLKKILTEMKCGDVLHVIATDPCSVSNIQYFIEITGNQLVVATEEAGEFHYYIKKT